MRIDRKQLRTFGALHPATYPGAKLLINIKNHGYIPHPQLPYTVKDAFIRGKRDNLFYERLSSGNYIIYLVDCYENPTKITDIGTVYTYDQNRDFVPNPPGKWYNFHEVVQ